MRFNSAYAMFIPRQLLEPREKPVMLFSRSVTSLASQRSGLTAKGSTKTVALLLKRYLKRYSLQDVIVCETVE